MTHHLQRLAFLSTHTSPLASPGGTKAGGMNVYIAELTAQLGSGGCEVDIFTRATEEGQPAVVQISDNVRLIHVPAGPVQELSPLEVYDWIDDFSRGVARYAADNGRAYDLVHSHYWLSGLSGIDLADRWRIPHVAMFHTLGEVKNRANRAEHEPPFRIEGERTVVRHADRLICATPHERDFLVQLYGAHRDCVSIVPAGVDLGRFCPGDRTQAKRDLNLGEELLVLFVGRIEPLKGVDILIQALAVTELDQPLTAIVAGGDAASADIAELRELAEAVGVADRVRFVGTLPRAELPTYYRAADVCVMPSYYESFGLVAVEALACGTPVIATRVGGLQHTVQDGRTGYLLSWRCPEPFAERIEALLENEDIRRRFGEAAPESVRRFSWDRVSAQILEVYEDLLQRHASGLATGCPAG